MATLEMERKVLTFTWKIKNFSFCWHRNYEKITSPYFKVHDRENSESRLILLPNIEGTYISCLFNEQPPFFFSIGFELAFLTDNESALYSIEASENTVKDFRDPIILNVQRNIVFGEERSTFLPDDTLTIQCKIWNVEGSTLETELCFAETEIEVQRTSSIWTIEGFSSIKEGEKITQNLEVTSAKPCFIFSLYLQNGICCIETKPHGAKSTKLCKCQMFCVDNTGKRIKCGRYEFLSDESVTHALSIITSDFLKNKKRYLPNDVLTLQYEIEFSTGNESKRILEVNSQSNLMHETHEIATDDISLSEVNYAKSSLSFKDDLLDIYKKGLHCDTILKTSSETFHVHSLILHIRSSVFSDILKTCESIGLKKCLYIKGVDANTVSNMVLYLYTDTLSNLDWESAKNLYFAANEYEISSLAQICSYFLTKGLQLSNCCEILSMAGKYQDIDLISAVQCFISKHAKSILMSDAWTDLEKNNPSLACNTLRKLYLKN